MEVVHADLLGGGSLLSLPDRDHLCSGHGPVAAAGVPVGHDAVADVQTRVRPVRYGPGRTEVDVVGVGGHDEDATDLF
jgi:hypothetical protein